MAVASVAMLTSCSRSFGCEPSPSSTGLAVGESAAVEIELVGGGWSSLDVGGAYWSTEAPVPDGLPADGRVEGVATLVSGDGDSPDQITSGSVSVAFSTDDVIAFEGPISCN